MRWPSGNTLSTSTTTTLSSFLSLLLLLSSLSIISVNAQVVPNTGIVIPLIYNNDYNPDALDLITQGILKYGIFKDVNKYPALKLRLTSVLGGLNLNLNVANLIKLDLGLGLNRRHVKKRRAATAAAIVEESNASLQDDNKHTSSDPSDHDKRLLGLELNLGSLLGVDLGLLDGGSSSSSSHSSAPTSPSSSSSSSLLDVQLGVQLIIDPGWDGATTTRLMNSQADNAWFANISFGTPAQTLTMFIDSGSADTTVFDPSCTTCALSTHKAFNHAASISYTSTTTSFYTEYGDGTRLTGRIGKDTVRLSSGLATSANQLLALITNQVKGSGARLYDGILGIGPDPLSFIENNVTPFSSLVKENKIINPVVGVALVKKSKITAGEQGGGGEYRWGSCTSPYVGSLPIVYTPVTSTYYWGVDVPRISVKGAQMYARTDTARRAIIDTGTTLIYTSNTVAANIHSRIPGSYRNTNEGVWYVPCGVSSIPSSTYPIPDPNVFFQIGGVNWGVPVEDLAFRVSGKNDGRCVSGIQGGSDQFIVLGGVFLKNHYLVLSYGNRQQTSLQVGLANRTDIPPIL